MMKNKRILVIAAHPDDEILGCSATIAKLVQDGYEAFTLILGEGVTSRDDIRDTIVREKEIKDLKKQIYQANQVIGVKECFIENFPDNRFDSIPILEIVKKIEQIKNYVKPDIIFTHYKNDLNIDHQVTFKSVITATRPMKEECVKEIYSFEILSSTEWNYPLTFSPNTFFEIKDTLELKKEAMKVYSSELREFPHPRSLKGIELCAENWGMKTGLNYAEAFMLVRKVI